MKIELTRNEARAVAWCLARVRQTMLDDEIGHEDVDFYGSVGAARASRTAEDKIKAAIEKGGRRGQAETIKHNG